MWTVEYMSMNGRVYDERKLLYQKFPHRAQDYHFVSILYRQAEKLLSTPLSDEEINGGSKSMCHLQSGRTSDQATSRNQVPKGNSLLFPLQHDVILLHYTSASTRLIQDAAT